MPLVVAASCVETAAGVLHNVTYGPFPGLGYWLVCAGLSLALALACSWVAGFTRRPEVVASAIWTAMVGGVLWGPAAGLIGAVAAATAVRWLLLAGRVGLTLGLVLGCTLYLAEVGWPAVLRRLPDAFAFQDSPLAGMGGPILTLGLLATCCVLERLRRHVGIAAVALLSLTMLGRSWDAPNPARVDWPADLRRAASTERPSILLLVLDTVSAERLSTYGAERETSPFLTHLVEAEGTARFSNAFSNAPWTGPSHASLFSGEIPSVHGVHYQSILPRMDSGGATLQAEVVLAERMRQAGYLTGALFANQGLRWVSGVDRGFDVFHYPPAPRAARGFGEALRRRIVPHAYAHRLTPYPDAGRVNEEVLHLIDSAGERPFFVVANYMEAHEPYSPRPPYRSQFSGRGWLGPGSSRFLFPDPGRHLTPSRYDEELASLDAHLRDLWKALEAKGADEKTWIFITADHGEAFGRHGFSGHGGSVYNDQTKVPLLIRAPRGEPTFEEAAQNEPVSLVDVGATIAAIGAGTRLGQGRDLRAVSSAPVRLEFFGNPQPFRIQMDGPVNFPSRSVVLGNRKLVERRGELELYDLQGDPQELRPLSMTPEEQELLEPLLPPLKHQPPTDPSPPNMSPEEMEALRALGYVE